VPRAKTESPLDPDHPHPVRAGSPPESSVVSREHEVGDFAVFPEQSSREVKRVQGSEDRRERLSGASEDQTIELHDVDVVERPKQHLPPIGDLLVGEE
jgi:hypothetical protein